MKDVDGVTALNTIYERNDVPLKRKCKYKFLETCCDTVVDDKNGIITARRNTVTKQQVT